MSVVASGWRLAIDRGPGWLIIQVAPSVEDGSETTGFAQAVWETLEQHLTYRVVLAMEDVHAINSEMIGQLRLLQKRIAERGGVLRLCGLPWQGEQTLRRFWLDQPLPNFGNPTDAIHGERPRVPR